MQAFFILLTLQTYNTLKVPVLFGIVWYCLVLFGYKMQKSNLFGVAFGSLVVDSMVIRWLIQWSLVVDSMVNSVVNSVVDSMVIGG